MQIISLFCCTLLLTVAQAGVQEDKSKSAAVELKLSAYESKVCLRSSLTLSLEIANTGQQQIKIHKGHLLSNFTLSAVGTNMVRTSISCGGYDNSPQYWIVLEPGEKYYDTFTYPLESDQFFKDASRYKISTSLSYNTGGKYDTATSNDAEFETYDCAAQ